MSSQGRHLADAARLSTATAVAAASECRLAFRSPAPLASDPLATAGGSEAHIEQLRQAGSSSLQPTILAFKRTGFPAPWQRMCMQYKIHNTQWLAGSSNCNSKLACGMAIFPLFLFASASLAACCCATSSARSLVALQAGKQAGKRQQELVSEAGPGRCECAKAAARNTANRNAECRGPVGRQQSANSDPVLEHPITS